MGNENSTNENKNNERFNTDYNQYFNSMNEKGDYNINVNKNFFHPGLENLNNKKTPNNRKIFIDKKTENQTISNNMPNMYVKNINNKFNTKSVSEEKSNKTNNKIYYEYFKCISCPMCVLVKINPKNNRVSIICENGHNNEMNIESFISIYKFFKYICDRCKKELSSKFFYCTQCKELFC